MNPSPIAPCRFLKQHGSHLGGQKRHFRGPRWFDDDYEQEEYIYGDERDLEDLPEEPPKQEWWVTGQHPSGMKEPDKPPKPSKPGPKPKSPKLKPPPTRPKGYLSNSPVTREDVAKHLFGEKHKPFYNYMKESRVERMSAFGELLVDTPEVQTNFEYWLQLLKFRARLHGDRGIKDIWFGLMIRQIELPIKGPIADEMWKLFVRAGLEDEDFLNKIYQYHLHIYHQRGERRWKPIYSEVVGGFLSKKPLRALWWHHRLIGQNPPKALVGFFERNASNPQNLPTLFKIFTSKKIGSMYYGTIIPFLCRQEQYDIAKVWHKMLFKKGDIPEQSHPADRLLEYYAFHERVTDLEAMLRDFHDKGIQVMESTVTSLIKARYRTPIVMELLCRLYDAKALSNECFGDKFWAFLLTYQHFSDANVSKYMAKLGISEIGELSAKEFVKKGRTIASFIRGISLLTRKRIEIGPEIYDKFMRVKARWAPEQAFQESLPLEELGVSRGNALLQGYLSTYRWKYFNLIYQKIRMRNYLTLNLFLRRLFMTRRIKSALELMEEMRALSMPIDPPAQRELLRAILLPRRSGRKPIIRDPQARKNRDLLLATNYLRAIMLNGGSVDPILWREILKRYGMFSKLKDLERLCMWLVDWYDPRKAALKQVDIPVKFTDVGRIATLKYAPVAWTEPPISLPVMSPQNPLRILFPAATIRSLVEWGFISMQRSWYLQLSRREDRLAVKSRLPKCTWGITLVKQLQKKGVRVDSRSVARAVRVRLRALEGSRTQWESFDTDMSKHKPIDLGSIAAISEEAWGHRLFPDGSWDTEAGLVKMLKAPVKDFVFRRRRLISRLQGRSAAAPQHK
ncbi:hypothetical protein ABW19_dt0202270 [Dactylella cylindrospora]|nr:hypothetical protein ABW19_dt0202270 [Dactylella cylindrospora]